MRDSIFSQRKPFWHYLERNWLLHFAELATLSPSHVTLVAERQSCQGNRNNSQVFFLQTFCVGTVLPSARELFTALVLVSYGHINHKHIYYWDLSGSTIWPLPEGKGRELSRERDALCLRAESSSCKPQVSLCAFSTLNFCPWNVLISIRTKDFETWQLF